MLSFSSILSDARNFISNNFTIIVTIVVILSIITQMINVLLSPSIETISPIKSILEQTIQQYGELSAEALTNTLNSLSEQQKQQLVPVAMSFLFKVGLVFLVTNLIAMSCVLATIYTISAQQFSLNNLLQSLIKIAPQILFFMLLAIPGFIILSLVASVLAPIAAPLGMLAAVFYMAAYIVFLAVIIDPMPYAGFIYKLKITLHFLRREMRLILPMVAIWLLASFLLKAMAGMLADNNFIVETIFSVFKLLLSFLTVCYLYRLYSLSNNMLPYDARN